MMMLHLILLLVSSHIGCLHGDTTELGVDYSCLTDYLYSINCTMTVSPQEAHVANHSYWLVFEDTEGDTRVCMMTWMDSYYSCSFDTLPEDEDSYAHTFFEIDRFKITRYHNSSDGHSHSQVLAEEYWPVKHIKPKTPCNLTVRWTSSQYNVTWKSSYEEYLYSYLIDNLMYELSYHRSGHQDNAITLSSVSMNITVDDHHFEPDSEYMFKVRSSPNQHIYTGQWSEWSSAFHWKTDNKPVVTLFEGKFIILICILPLILLLLCYIPVVKMRKNTSIPTPAPYFQSLYRDCEGDFKSWVVTPSNEGDIVETEDTLQIAVLLGEEDAPQPLPSTPYSTVQDPPADRLFHPASEAPPLGSAPAGSPTLPPPTQRGPVESLSLSSDPELSLEEDSGCWLCSAASLEQEIHWYSNEYCTLTPLPRVLHPDPPT